MDQWPSPKHVKHWVFLAIVVGGRPAGAPSGAGGGSGGSPAGGTIIGAKPCIIPAIFRRHTHKDL